MTSFSLKEHPDYPRPLLWIAPDQVCGAAIVLHKFTPDQPATSSLEM